eukprot:COSAG01_NODE_19640_length_998_cov_62.401557_2_plen_56_part_00
MTETYHGTYVYSGFVLLTTGVMTGTIDSRVTAHAAWLRCAYEYLYEYLYSCTVAS